MANVGGIECTFVKGEVRGLKPRGVVWQVPGLNGYGAQVLGLGDAEFEFRAILYSTLAVVETWFRTIEALQFSTVSIVDDGAITYTNLMITSVGIPQRQVAIDPGASYDTRGEITVSGVKVA